MTRSLVRSTVRRRAPRPLVRACATAAVVAALPIAAHAQAPAAEAPAEPRCTLLCAPSFLAQPGVVVANAVNAPALDAAGGRAPRSPELLLRVTTAVPTRLERLTLVGIVQFTPFARETVPAAAGARAVTVTRNAPTFVYGSVFDVASAGPLGVTFNVLGAYGRHGVADRAGDVQDYRHQLVFEVDANLAVGRYLGSALRGVSAYAFLAQPMTGRPQDVRGQRVYSPTLLTGLTVPLARAGATR